MKTIRVRLKALRSEEHFQFFTEFKELIEHFSASALELVKLFAGLVILYAKADKLLHVLRASNYTHYLEAADRIRDDVFRGFCEVVRGSLKHPDEAKRKAAGRLSLLLKGYRKAVLDESYAAESAALHNLLQDLNGSRKADVTLLALTDWVTAISRAEQAFLDISEKRATESYDKPKSDLRLIQNKMNSLYTAMINVLDAQVLAESLSGDTDTDPEDLDNEDRFDGEKDQSHELHGNVSYNFVTAWNVRVKKYHNLVAQRAGRRAKHNESAEPEA
jgi:hypothetical protein